MSDAKTLQRPEAPGQRSGQPGNDGGTVTVACKLPHGLQLQLQTKTNVKIVTRDGGQQDAVQWAKDGVTYTVHGTAIAKGEIPRYKMVAGYALTPGIPKNFWDAWWDQNQSAPYCKQNLIFAYESLDRVRGTAKDNREVRTGQEPLNSDIKADPRQALLKSNRKGVGSPTQASRDEKLGEVGDEE